MKVIITTLKAPWPAGAKVGDVVSFEGDKVPSWAAGKFREAPADASVDHEYQPVLVIDGDSRGTALAAVESVNLQVEDLQRRLEGALTKALELQDVNIELSRDLGEERAASSTLRGQLAESASALKVAQGDAVQASTERDELRGKLTAAEAALTSAASSATKGKGK